METEEANETFSRISEDILVNIFSKLDEDPRCLACLACVCTRFSAIIKGTCCRNICLSVIPTVVSDFLQPTRRIDRLEEPPGGWAGLQKLAVCCPGLWHAGVLLECWDFGLERELGPSEQYTIQAALPTAAAEPNGERNAGGTSDNHYSSCWTLFDDLPFDLVCGVAEASARAESRDQYDLLGEARGEAPEAVENRAAPRAVSHGTPVGGSQAEGGVQENPLGLGFGEMVGNRGEGVEPVENRESRSELHKRKENPLQDCPPVQTVVLDGTEEAEADSKKRKMDSPVRPHLATGIWNLTREEGNKLLASRFRSDSLYICDWPGCVHSEEKRKYRLFRGVFKNFKNSYVWRNIKDLKAKKTVLTCAFCSSKGTWDMLTTFCLRRSFEYHDDGEPVVRAYVCENGHVSGAWTDRPMYN